MVDPEPEPQPDPEPQPAEITELIVNVEGEMDLFYVRGLDGGYCDIVETSMTMGPENRVWLLDNPWDDQTLWTYKDDYLGGSIMYEVDVS